MKIIYKKISKKTLLSILTLHLSLLSFATNYYVGNSGNDSNNGTSTSTPWKTLDKVNSMNFVAGDQILFEKGGTFYGTLSIHGLGSSGSPITFSSYGLGANPVITGFSTVTAWTSLGNNIWESTNAVSTLSTCNMVSVNGINTPMGRYPNSGYLTAKSNTTTSLTSSSLTGTPNWTGATLVYKTSEYFLSRLVITSQSTSTLNWSASVGGSGTEFFIQNDIKTLDRQNEWYYNPTTKKLSIYSTSMPVNVSIATVENVLEYAKNTYNYSQCDYVNIENISFLGSNSNTINGYPSLVAGHNLHDINIKNCTISFSGKDGIWIDSDNIVIDNNTIHDTNGAAITTAYSGSVTVKNNILLDISLISGAGGEYGDCAIASFNNTTLNIEKNTITNCGFNGISFQSTSIATVNNNYISSFNSKLHDGGAITSGGPKAIGTTINGNVCIGGVGFTGLTCGIYLDDDSSNTEVANNTVSGCYWIGIYLHNANTNNVHDNIVFNNGVQIRTADDGLGGDIFSNSITNNQFIAKTANQYVAAFSSNQNNLTSIGTFNNNYYARPIDDNITFSTYQPSTGGINRTLAQWQSFSKQDINSLKSPLAISSESDLQLEYNASQSPKTVSLARPMVDVKGTKYYNSITLQPYSSAVLMKDPNPVQPIIPVYVGSVVNDGSPTILELTFDQSLSNQIPTSSAFIVQVNSAVRSINSVSISGNKVMLTLSQPIVFGDIVTVAYTKPSTNPLQTESAGQVDSFNAKPATNDILDLKQAAILTSHFIPVWQGENGINHMNLMVVSATFDDLPLSSDDEIAVFSGSNCVGAVKLTQLINTSNPATYLTISASQSDGSNNGFISNDTIIFRIWVNSSQKEIVAKAVSYKNDLSSWLTTGKYSAGATSVVDLVSYTEYTQTISLLKGYNMISTYVKAADPSVCSVTKPLCDQGNLIKVQDEAGNSYEDWGSFGGWVNKLGSFQETEGYKIKVSSNCTFQVTGRPIALPLDIPLKTGWNIISFPRTDLVDALNIIQPLIDQNKLIKVQDEAGNSIEDWGIFGGWKNDIGNFVPGKAYKVKLNADAVLTIQENYTKSAVIMAQVEKTEYFSTVAEGNGTDHMNINVVGLRESGLSIGDEVAAFDGNICVGSIKITEKNMVDGCASIPASFSTNDQSPDGFKEGDSIELFAWNRLNNVETEIQTEILNGKYTYSKNSSVLVRAKSATTAVVNFNSSVTIDVFPNPTAGKVTIRFSTLPEAGSSIDILDIAGRKVASRFVTGTVEEFNLDGQSAGLYLVKTSLGSTEAIHKLIVNK